MNITAYRYIPRTSWKRSGRTGAACSIIPTAVSVSPCRHLYEINIDWLVTVWERYLELCAGQKLWKQNAAAFLKESTDKTEAEISAFVDSGWDRCSAYTDNLKRFLGKDEAKEVWVFSFPMDDFGRDAPDKERSFSITRTTRIQRLKR
ncbi:hypothetical protein NXY25_03885 [Bacteroides thetaiotaomicron]|nr:hypothetical protein [Bacteroides thetaiotaomicron]